MTVFKNLFTAEKKNLKHTQEMGTLPHPVLTTPPIPTPVDCYLFPCPSPSGILKDLQTLYHLCQHAIVKIKETLSGKMCPFISHLDNHRFNYIPGSLLCAERRLGNE